VWEARRRRGASNRPHRRFDVVREEDPIEASRTPDDRFEGLRDWRFEPQYVQLGALRMHYVDEGAGPPVLLLHGEPTWSFLYRKVIAELAGSARCVAPDYFGFGRSDKPVDPGWYSYDAHFLAIERLVRELDLHRLTVVVQDWGGPIGFRLCVEQPQRVERLVVLNTGIGARAPNDEWLRFQAYMRRVGTDIEVGRLVRRTLVQPVSDEVVAGYDAPFPEPRSRIGVVRFPELVPTSSEHPSAAAMLDVRERLRRFEQPALVLFGADDPIFPRPAAEAMAALLPNATLDPPLEGAGHFLQEDRGAEVGRRIAAFLR
jgi:haloalkane dehalogenase